MFDVIKPYPANRLEKFHGGFGIMADDAMAGVYANLSLRLLIWLLPGLDSLRRMAPRTAEIIAVGSELLGSTRTDTNSLYLSGRLSELGIDLRIKSVVGDEREDLATLLAPGARRARTSSC